MTSGKIQQQINNGGITAVEIRWRMIAYLEYKIASCTGGSGVMCMRPWRYVQAQQPLHLLRYAQAMLWFTSKRIGKIQWGQELPRVISLSREMGHTYKNSFLILQRLWKLEKIWKKLAQWLMESNPIISCATIFVLLEVLILFSEQHLSLVVICTYKSGLNLRNIRKCYLCSYSCPESIFQKKKEKEGAHAPPYSSTVPGIHFFEVL